TMDMSEASSRLMVSGYASAQSGSILVVTNGTVLTSDLDSQIIADLGWLTKDSIDATAGLTVDWSYRSLTNFTEMAESVGTNTLFAMDDAITSMTSEDFRSLNASGAGGRGEKLVYSALQMPGIANAGFQTQQQVNQLLAARGTEFRSLNGFASTKASPSGAAGPDNAIGELNGWIRGYGVLAEQDEADSFDALDTKSYGTVIGIDKSFGNLLIGLAGGMGGSNIDADFGSSADIDSYQGSIYSTIGGEKLFVDLAFGYTAIETTEKPLGSITSFEFDSEILSTYLGAGYSFDITEKIILTPEISGLYSEYSQDEYTRKVILTQNVDSYDSESILGSIGATISTAHQIDILKLQTAIIPELRAHWLHEFNADMDDGSFTYSNFGGGTGVLQVRAREEDLYKLGFGLDMWNWKAESTKFELDYDGLFGDAYTEHTISGKITYKF
ncbi:MAG TPA: autotransporter outer membrane beta-barrel domain-containing protein, partial [Pontiella sp.]